MSETCTLNQLTTNDNVFFIIDKWMKKYNTSPKRYIGNNNGIASLTIEWDYKSESSVEKQNLIKSLKSWAEKNKKIVIITSFSIIVLATSGIILNSPIISLKNLVTGNYSLLFNGVNLENGDASAEMTSGVYYVDENSRIVNEEENPEAYLVEIEINDRGEPIFHIGSSIVDDQEIKSSVELMMTEYLQTAEEKIEELESLIEEELRVSEEKKYIEFYCAVYGLNYDVVYQALSDLTNNFTDEAYLNNFEIGTSILKGRYIKCTSKEMAILIAVRNIYYDPARYGCPKDNLWTGVEFRTDVDYSHQIGYLSNVLEIDPALNWAICNAECSFKSDLFLNGHNPSGLNFGNGFEHFPSITAGFIEQSLELVKHKRAGRTTISTIGAVHAPVYEDEEGNLVNAHWIPNVTGGYNTATRNYESFFGYDEENDFFTTPSEEKTYIQLYSTIYGLDVSKVYKIISDMTDNFSSELYLQHNVIENDNKNSGMDYYESKEVAILFTIRNIYMNPEQYGTTREEIKGEELYNSNLSYAKQIEYLSNVLGVDTSLNYTLCQAICGFKSPMFTVKNNPTNIMSDGTYTTFPTVTAGFLEQTIELLNMKLNGSTSLNDVGQRINYSPYKDETDWNLYIYEIYNYVSNNYDSIFEPNEALELSNQKVYEFR